MGRFIAGLVLGAVLSGVACYAYFAREELEASVRNSNPRAVASVLHGVDEDVAAINRRFNVMVSEFSEQEWKAGTDRIFTGDLS